MISGATYTRRVSVATRNFIVKRCNSLYDATGYAMRNLHQPSEASNTALQAQKRSLFLTDSEVIKIVRDHIERQFPMKCSMCEHRFLTLKDYLEYTTHLGEPVSYDAEKGDWRPLEPLGTLSYANCRCGTTLTISSHGMGLLTMWRLLRWARTESSRRKIGMSELLHDLRQKIDRQVLSEK